MSDPVETRGPERWWITTDKLDRGGKKKLGPFESKDLALAVRTYVELAERGNKTYWLEKEDAPADGRED